MSASEPTPFLRFQDLVRRLSDHAPAIKAYLENIDEQEWELMTVIRPNHSLISWVQVLFDALYSAVKEEESHDRVSG